MSLQEKTRFEPKGEQALQKARVGAIKTRRNTFCYDSGLLSFKQKQETTSSFFDDANLTSTWVKPNQTEEALLLLSNGAL
jgi:hypothetical protein